MVSDVSAEMFYFITYNILFFKDLVGFNWHPRVLRGKADVILRSRGKLTETNYKFITFFACLLGHHAARLCAGE